LGIVKVLQLVGCLAAVAITFAVIELTGGLPSQMAHLYYLPVVLSALVLPRGLSLPVALLAAAAVSPLPDLFHSMAGMDLYYDDPAPWRLASNGWIVRPIAFIVISLVTGAVLRERVQRLAAQEDAQMAQGKVLEERTARLSADVASYSRSKELNLLGEIDKKILSGSPEEETVREIAKLVQAFTGAKVAGIELPVQGDNKTRLIYGQSLTPQATETLERGLPLHEGVSGWALQHGRATTSSNVFSDARYHRTAVLAKQIGYTSAAAAPVILDGEILGSLVVGYPNERVFTADEINTLERLANQAAIAIANSRQRESLRLLTHETAIALAEAIESRDPYTGDHCARLAHFASLTAASLQLDAREREMIRLGAALHDIGKITVPDNILKKPDKLTPDEYAIIKQHCYSGGQICKRVSFLRSVYPIVYHHHERFDGRGYPDGIARNSIPLGARIVSVVDAYDAMTSDRTYRKAMPRAEAEAILRDGAGSQWDPQMVETFLSSLVPPNPKQAAGVR
jgi:putative nucleotidyltransferase with HDIG domain